MRDVEGGGVKKRIFHVTSSMDEPTMLVSRAHPVAVLKFIPDSAEMNIELSILKFLMNHKPNAR